MELIAAIARTSYVTSTKILSFGLSIAFLCAPVAASAAGKSAKRADAPPRTEIAKKKSELEIKVDEYKESLRALLPLREKAVADQSAKVDQVRGLVESGLVAKREVDDQVMRLADLQSKLAETQKQLSEADGILEEAEEAERLARQPLPRGGFLATSAIMRYNGATPWSIQNVSLVQSFFSQKFGHAAPISALGQTETHNHLGFDHRNAVDVAVRPDSAEGQALMSYLQSAGIPYLAFRAAVPGKATGPHIHIGLPSHRFR